jgi:hypothetical protein
VLLKSCVCLLAMMKWLTRFFYASGDAAGHSQKRLNAYNAWVILFVSIGSLCYGYTANVISATLGQYPLRSSIQEPIH